MGLLGIWNCGIQLGTMALCVVTSGPGNAHNGSVARRARFAFMPDEQVLKHGVDAFIFLLVQFRIFVK